MKRKIMLLALGANIGGRGAVGFTASDGETGGGLVSPAINERFSSAVSAAAPIPKPACLKKYLRVTDCSISSAPFIGMNLMKNSLAPFYFLHFTALLFPFP